MNRIQKLGIGMLLLGSLLVSCSGDDVSEVPVVNDGSLLVQLEPVRPNSRISFTSEGKFFWSEGDNLAVSSKTGTIFYSFELKKEDEGKSQGSFSGLTEGGVGKYALYPFAASNQISGSTLTYVYPTEYVYEKVDQQVPSTAATGLNSVEAPMAGLIEGTSVTLKHLGGLIRVVVEKMPSTEGDFIFATDAFITGTYQADLAVANACLKAGSTAGLGKQVIIHYAPESASKDQKGIFYIPVPAGDYGRFDMGFDADRDGTPDFMTSIEQPTRIDRATIDEWHLQSVSFGDGSSSE